MIKNLDNHVWRVKWRLLDTFKMAWEELGDGVDFNDLLDMTAETMQEMQNDGRFDAPMFSDQLDGVEHKWIAGLIELYKRKEEFGGEG